MTTRIEWPVLEYEKWKDSIATFHMWTQIVGKIRLVQSPWVNHSWHVPLYLTSRGLTTSVIPHERAIFQIDFDFVDHRLEVSDSSGGRESFSLEPMSVASFYEKLFNLLTDMDLEVEIVASPNEVPRPALIALVRRISEQVRLDAGIEGKSAV